MTYYFVNLPSILSWLKSHYRHVVIPCCIIYIQYLFFSGNTLPSPSSTKSFESPTLVRPAEAGTPSAVVALPDGVYHNPHPVQTPMHDLPEALVGLWKQGIEMDLIVYINQNEYFTDYHLSPSCKISHLILGQSFDIQARHLTISLSNVQFNLTLYAHIFLTRTESPIHPQAVGFNPDHIVYKRHRLTKHYTKNTSSPFVMLKSYMQYAFYSPHHHYDHASSQPTSLVSYWQDTMTIALVNDGREAIPKAALQPATLKYISLERITTKEKGIHQHPPLLASVNGYQIGFYRPIVFPNDFWSLQRHAYPVNENTTHLPLTIQVEPMAMWKFNTLAAFEDVSNPFGGTMEEMEQVKRLFLEMNPTWLCTLLLLCGLYGCFSFLAFQNDILFWQTKNNDRGISIFGMQLQMLAHVILLLNLMEIHRGTGLPLVLLLTRGFSMAIHAWKMDKALSSSQQQLRQQRQQQQQQQMISSTFDENWPTTTNNDRLFSNNDETMIMKVTPLPEYSNVKSLGTVFLCCLCVWHIGLSTWGSTIIHMLSEIIRCFDFLFLLPQVFKNHQSRKVEHISRHTLIYKSFNVVIDAVFAIIVKTPFLHRITCFHQDILYIYIFYQHSIYTSSSSS
ncbi:cleft lip and palate transmembrane protein 1-domain-containing protein [Halteromyces radiatus]|uniref:cleft lip and palate transmembrane protein 1-domain-containing protein n=1 Tax=Halteromyces radiatus TaxID=101107 RepID=UPI00221E8D20|nr:cleft lip and palate transmembrane protein 1-domain-containing protein [Halteromyces radiatus]KAI8099508.1 cleft lip and palate transmembrane protein 1-domain-containing protein [Halteromyces radiatus]